MKARHALVEALISAAIRFSHLANETIGVNWKIDVELAKAWETVAQAGRQVHRLLNEPNIQSELVENWLGLPLTKEEAAALEILHGAIVFRLGHQAQWSDCITAVQRANIEILMQSNSRKERTERGVKALGGVWVQEPEITPEVCESILILLAMAGLPSVLNVFKASEGRAPSLRLFSFFLRTGGPLILSLPQGKLLTQRMLMPNIGNSIAHVDLHAAGEPYYYENGLRCDHVYAQDVIKPVIAQLAEGQPFVIAAADTGRAKCTDAGHLDRFHCWQLNTRRFLMFYRKPMSAGASS